MSDEIVKSPCINICELGTDNICNGCFRSLEDITFWDHANSEQRIKIIADAKLRKLTVSND